MHSESSQQGNGNMRGKFRIVGGTLFLANVLIVTSILFIMKMHSNSNTPFPEPLIPFVDPETDSPLCGTAAVLKACNATVSAGQNQPYWIDISVPHGAANSPAGTYTGTISITSNQGNVTIPVALTVWNFE